MTSLKCTYDWHQKIMLPSAGANCQDFGALACLLVSAHNLKEK